MQRFGSTFVVKFNALFFLTLFVGAVYFTLNVPNRSMVVTGTIVFGLLTIFAGWLAWTALLAASIVYELDAERITRKSLTGTQTLRWRDLVRYTTSTTPFYSRLVLMDHRGQKLVVLWGTIHRQRDMNDLIQPRLTAIHENQLSEVGNKERVYHLKRNAGWAALILVMMCVVAMGGVWSIPFKPSDEGFKVGVVLFFGFGALGSLALTLYAFTNALTITDYDLTESSLFGAKRIAFRSVIMVTSRDVRTQNGSFNQTTVEGDGKKIILTSMMKDYGLLVDYIKSHVSEPARERGEAKARAINAKEIKQSRIALPIVGMILLAGFVGFGVMNLQKGNASLERYRLVDTQGVTAVGRITERHARGSKNTRYLLDYSFTDSRGLPREGEDRVSWEDYYSARIGGTVQVIYVPGRPDVSRLTQSIGKRAAEVDVVLGYIYIGAGVILTPLSLIRTNRQLNRRAAQA